jgi:hypothetical protein
MPGERPPGRNGTSELDPDEALRRCIPCNGPMDYLMLMMSITAPIVVLVVAWLVLNQ